MFGSTKLNHVSLTPCPLFLHSTPVFTGGSAPNVRPHRVTAAFASSRTIQRWGSSGIMLCSKYTLKKFVFGTESVRVHGWNLVSETHTAWSVDRCFSEPHGLLTFVIDTDSESHRCTVHFIKSFQLWTNKCTYTTFHLKHFKTLKTTPTCFDLFRSSSGSFVVPCKINTYSRFSSFL